MINGIHDQYHSMAKDNLNKSKETTPMTSAALKVAAYSLFC